MNNIFLPNPKKNVKRKNCGRLTGHNCGHPLDEKQKLFLVWPEPSPKPFTRDVSLCCSYSTVFSVRFFQMGRIIIFMAFIVPSLFMDYSFVVYVKVTRDTLKKL